MSEIRLLVLGSPRLERGEKLVELETRKAMALLVFLAVTNQSHSRDTLATLFWPDSNQSRGRTYLRRALWMLKKAIGDTHLIIERHSVGFASETGMWLDLTQFHHLLSSCEQHGHPNDEICIDCLPLLEEAVGLYRDDFLAGFTLSDSTEFDDWQFFQAEGLRQEFASALECLVQGHSAQREYEEAISYARRRIALDSLHESAHRELMRLYALAGRRHEALRQYKTCVEILAAELGASPAPETETLYQQIVSGDLNPPPALTPKPPWVTPTPIAVEIERSAPLVGRKAEFEMVQAKIRNAWQNQGCTILLAGDSGVGKTRLAYESLRDATRSGITTLVGAAYEQEGHLAYHPFIEAIDRYLTEQQLPPENNPITYYKPMGSSDPQQEHSALFRAVGAFLSNLATDKPVALLLDDLHAADEASMSLFHYLSRQTRAAPIILMATYRTDIPVSGLSPFGSLINALYREGTSDTLSLLPLSGEAGAEIINHTLGGHAEPRLVKAVFEIAEGNPFYIQEITQAMLKADNLSQKDGQWSLQSEARLQIPTELQDLLQERVQRLGPDVETMLTTAAVVGREFRFAVLRHVTDLADGELFDTLDAALDARLLEETDYGYRFHHGLIRRTLYDLLSRRRRAWLHTRTAEAIEATYTQRPEGVMPHIEALAFHYELSDRRDKALPYLVQAAQNASELFALEVANDYLERALALMDELGVQDPNYRWPVLEKLGMLATILADTSRAVARFDQALALPASDDWQPEPGDLVRLHRYASRTLITAGKPDGAQQHLQAAVDIMGDTRQGSLDYGHLLYDVALWHWHNNEYQEAFETAQRSLHIAEQLNNDPARAQAYEMLALACHSLGEWQQGLDYEQQRSTLVGPNLDVTEAFDTHL